MRQKGRSLLCTGNSSWKVPSWKSCWISRHLSQDLENASSGEFCGFQNGPGNDAHLMGSRNSGESNVVIVPRVHHSRSVLGPLSPQWAVFSPSSSLKHGPVGISMGSSCTPCHPHFAHKLSAVLNSSPTADQNVSFLTYSSGEP